MGRALRALGVSGLRLLVPFARLTFVYFAASLCRPLNFTFRLFVIHTGCRASNTEGRAVAVVRPVSLSCSGFIFLKILPSLLILPRSNLLTSHKPATNYIIIIISH
jgi:hypothetical protein